MCHANHQINETISGTRPSNRNMSIIPLAVPTHEICTYRSVFASSQRHLLRCSVSIAAAAHSRQKAPSPSSTPRHPQKALTL